MDGDRLAAFSSEDEISVAGGEAQDFVRGGVVVVEVVDAVAPLRGPAVGGEEMLHGVGEGVRWIWAGWKGVTVEEDWQRTVGHPAVGLQVELLRRVNDMAAARS